MTKNKTRLLSVGLAMIVLLAALLVIPRLSATASAAWSESAADGLVGSCTDADPYKITSGEELAYLAKTVNEGEKYDGKYFVLANDIDLGGKEWTPISYSGYDKNGNPIKTTDFAGIFDGQVNTISNLTISENVASKHLGLFGYSSGTIKNLYLDNAKISSYIGIGTICTYNSGTIEACGVNSGELTTAGSIGGVCEENSGTISKCYNMANIVGGSENGGVCATNSARAVIENCYNGGSIAATAGISNGGICSKNSGTISRCLNFGKLGGGEENGATYYGVCGNGTGTMTDCFNDSSVSDVSASGYGSTKTNVENKTTLELCSSDSFDGLGRDTVWHYGGLRTLRPDPGFSDRRNSDRFCIGEYA